jgi:ecotin
MNTYYLASAVLLLCLSSAGAADEAERNLKAFPPAEAGQSRFVILLTKQENEDAFRVELQIGKTVLVDGVNRHFFGGKLETKNIEGWGFNRYVLKELGPMAGTLIGVDPAQPMVERFVMLGGDAQLLRYNSRLPLVVYVPEGVEVRYRVWRADAKATPAKSG